MDDERGIKPVPPSELDDFGDIPFRIILTWILLYAAGAESKILIN